MKRVEEIVKIVSPKKVEGPVTSVVSHITADSRTVQEGSLFICLVANVLADSFHTACSLFILRVTVSGALNKSFILTFSKTSAIFLH